MNNPYEDILKKHKNGEEITFLDKIRLNSYYPLTSNNYFYLHPTDNGKNHTNQKSNEKV